LPAQSAAFVGRPVALGPLAIGVIEDGMPTGVDFGIEEVSVWPVAEPGVNTASGTGFVGVASGRELHAVCAASHAAPATGARANKILRINRTSTTTSGRRTARPENSDCESDTADRLVVSVKRPRWNVVSVIAGSVLKFRVRAFDRRVSAT
jgi:hypothetical protein